MKQGEGRLPASVHTEGNRGTLVFALTPYGLYRITKQIQQGHSEELPVMLWSWGMYHCCLLGGKKKFLTVSWGNSFLESLIWNPDSFPVPLHLADARSRLLAHPADYPGSWWPKFQLAVSDSGLVLTTEVSIEMLLASGDTLKLFV